MAPLRAMALHRAMASHNRGMGGQAREDRGARGEGRDRPDINGLEQLQEVTVEGGSRPGQLFVLNYYEPANDYIYSRVAWFKLLGLGHTLHTARASLRIAVQNEGLYNSTKAMLTEDLPK